MNLKIEKIVVGDLNTNCYVITNEKKEAIIIDPGAEANKIIDFVKNYKVEEILVTHHHEDHIGALKELENYFQIKENQKSNKFDYERIKTKGHTLDSESFYFPSINSVFVGDFIFYHGIGRTDLGGSSKEMKNSIQDFKEKFKENILIYPGHGKETTLKEELPYLTYYEKTL